MSKDLLDKTHRLQSFSLPLLFTYSKYNLTTFLLAIAPQQMYLAHVLNKITTGVRWLQFKPCPREKASEDISSFEIDFRRLDNIIQSNSMLKEYIVDHLHQKSMLRRPVIQVWTAEECK